MKKNMKELDKTQLEMVNGGSESEIVIDDLALVPELDEIDESEVITIRQRIPARRPHTRSRSINTGRGGITVSASRSNPPIHYQ